MFDLLVKVIDRFITLAETAEKNDRRLYEDIVRPALSDLEALHASYMTRLERYEAMLSEARFLDSTNPILKLIEQDRGTSRLLKLRVERFSSFSDHGDIGFLMRCLAFYVSGISFDTVIYDGVPIERKPYGASTFPSRELEVRDMAPVRFRRPEDLLAETQREDTISVMASLRAGLVHVFSGNAEDDQSDMADRERELRLRRAHQLFGRARDELNARYERVLREEMAVRTALLMPK